MRTALRSVEVCPARQGGGEARPPVGSQETGAPRAAASYSEDACLDAIHVPGLGSWWCRPCFGAGVQNSRSQTVSVDSVAAHLRTFEGDPGRGFGSSRSSLWTCRGWLGAGVAVVVSNQLASNLTSDKPGPALGEAWSHACDERLDACSAIGEAVGDAGEEFSEGGRRRACGGSERARRARSGGGPAVAYGTA